MSAALPVEEALLLASTAATLARRGWPAAKTAKLLAEALPHGPARAELATAADALARGERFESPAGALSTSALLARGEIAGAESLAELARSHALEIRSRRLAAVAVAYPAAGLAFGIVLLVLGGFVMDTSMALYGEIAPSPSGPAMVSTGILRTAGYLGGIFAIVSTIGLVAALLGRGFLPGVTSTRAASMLRRLAAALAAGIAEKDAFALAHPGANGFDSLALRERERALATRLASLYGAEAAARALAEELERDGREASRMWRLLLPYAGVVALLMVFGLLGLSLMSPIFALGSIF